MALNIPLYDGWMLRSDSSNIILSRQNETYFYSTIESALVCFIEKKIKGFDSTSIKGLVEAIKSLRTALNTSLQPLNLVCVPVSTIQTKLGGEDGNTKGS